MSLIISNWFKSAEEAGTSSSSSSRADEGGTSSSSVHADGWRRPRSPSRSRRSSREDSMAPRHTWPAPTPTRHTPSLLHRTGGLSCQLTKVGAPSHNPRAPQPQGQGQRALERRLDAPLARVRLHRSCSFSPRLALTLPRRPGRDAALLALPAAADGGLHSEPLRHVGLAATLLDPRTRHAAAVCIRAATIGDRESCTSS